MYNSYRITLLLEVNQSDPGEFSEKNSLDRCEYLKNTRGTTLKLLHQINHVNYNVKGRTCLMTNQSLWNWVGFIIAHALVSHRASFSLLDRGTHVGNYD